MDINYNDLDEKLEFYCHKCHRGLLLPPARTEVRYCGYCGHKFEYSKINNVRYKIKKLCIEEGH